MKTASEPVPVDLHRLLIASNRVRNLHVIGECLRLEVTAVLYRYDSDTLESILGWASVRIIVKFLGGIMENPEVYSCNPQIKWEGG